MGFLSTAVRVSKIKLNLWISQPRHIELPDEDIDAVGCFLEFLYTGEYFPRKLLGQRTLEHDPSIPAVDDSGVQLLKHAKIYTLAQKWGVTSLQSLSASKIHCINSTVKGEIAYARYVYANTALDDTTIRAPVASFWAARSHTLRSEAEDEFKALCLEFPQFGFDILSMFSWLPFLFSFSWCQANLLQPVFWMTSSRGSATKRCTLPPAASASAPDTAAAVLRKWRDVLFPVQHGLLFGLTRTPTCSMYLSPGYI